MSGSGLQTVGSVLVGSAVSLWAGYWIYALQDSSVHVNSWPTWALVAVAIVGLLVLIAGVRHESESQGAVMKQRGGNSSFNVQSGRDTVIDPTKDRDV